MRSVLRSLRVAGFLARRALTRGNSGVALGTVAMMGLIYVQLLFIPGLIRGAITTVESQLIDTMTAHVQVLPGDGATTIVDAAPVIDEIESLPGVVAASAWLRIGSQISAGSQSGSWPVNAVDPVADAATFATAANLIEGRWLEPSDTDAIVLGIGIAGAELTDVASYRRSLRDVHVGDSVTVTLLDGSAVQLTVVGIYENQFVESDKTGFVAKGAVERIDPIFAGGANSVFVRLQSRAQAEEVAAILRDGEPSLGYETWIDQLSAVDDQISSFDLIKSILRVASLIIAGVAVVIVTYVDLAGKRRTIGIERAIGVRAEAIVATYLLKAVVYALAGVAFGVALALLVVVPVIDAHPFSFPVGDVRLDITGQEFRRDAVILIGVAVLAALYPAWRAVRVRLLDAIWGR